MAGLIPDSIDWRAYERDSEAKVKVRQASDFRDDLAAALAPPERDRFTPEMFSTKLRERLVFRPGEVTVWSGYNGHRKSMFTGQVALDLCVCRQRVMMASLEMHPGQTLARMAKQAYGCARLTADAIERFARWTDGRLWLFDHVGRVSPEQALAVMRYFAEELGGTQVVIDSMMMVCRSEESLDEQKQLMTDLVRSAQELCFHVHLVAHCRKPAAGADEKPPTKYDLRGSAAISDQAHNVVTVWSNKPKRAKLEKDPNDSAALAEPDALVTVEKQRNGEWEGRVKLWWHEPSLRFVDSQSARVDPYRMIGED